MPASKVIQIPRCRVCGKPVSAKEDVAFGVGKTPLFYAHAGDCADTINDVTELVGKFTRIQLDKKRPGLSNKLARTVGKFQRIFNILSE